MLTRGTRVGAYEIVDTLGQGGMGEVYRARDTRLNRDVAVKVLPPAFASDPKRHRQQYVVANDGQSFIMNSPYESRLFRRSASS